MAEALVNQYGPEVPRQLADRLLSVYPDFLHQRFLQHCLDGYDELGLMARGRRMADALALCLPADFNQAADILLASLAEPLSTDRSFAMSTFVYLPHGFYVADRGLPHHHARSMELLHAITQRFTSEFAIRRFLIEATEPTLITLRQWCDDPSEHVRRLVSEGTRPRLPWAARLPAFQRDPAPVFELLERLKDDPSEYVRRSVANNLNDIGKDHPEQVLALAQRWLQQASTERQRLIRHALRTLVKAGNPQALALLGYAPGQHLAVGKVSLAPAAPQRGGEVQISCELRNESPQTQSLCVDLRVQYVRSHGRHSTKVFKWKTLELAAGQSCLLTYRLSLAEMTTRKHYPGLHPVTVLVNGQPYDLGAFDLQ